MKKIIKLFLVSFLAMGVSSCMKDNSFPNYDGQAMLEIEKPLIEEYIAENPELAGLVQYKESGIWYEIIEPGVMPETDEEGNIVTDNGYYEYNINNAGRIEPARIGVEYVGRLVATGSVFEEGSTGVEDDRLLSLDGVIQGWQVAFLPKMLKDKDGEEIKIDGLTELGLQKGSEIRIILPSPYAYRNGSTQKVPANSPLDFTIKVLKVIPPKPGI